MFSTKRGKNRFFGLVCMGTRYYLKYENAVDVPFEGNLILKQGTITVIGSIKPFSNNTPPSFYIN